MDGTRDIAEGLSIFQELVVVVVNGERADSINLLNFLLLGGKIQQIVNKYTGMYSTVFMYKYSV